jgi:hypothetical protein
MNLYYQHALKVIIYLGEEADGSEKVPALLDMIYARLFPALKSAYPSVALDSIPLPPPEILLALGILPTGAPEWNALGHLFQRPWWSRYWIIQELVLASKAELICGRWACDWDRFAIAIRVVSMHPKFALDEGGENKILEAVKRGERNFVNLQMLRKSVERSDISATVNILQGSQVPVTLQKIFPKWSLVDLLERCRQSQATNAQDYVYAMIGMSVEEATGKFQNILPSYDESVAGTFIRYARHMVDWGDSVKLLYSASSGRIRDADLPSWVPNWADRNPHATPLSPRFDGGVNYYYRAALDTQPFVKLSTVSDHMIIRGVVVDTITGVGPVTYRAPISGGFSVFERDLDVVAASVTALLRFLEQKGRDWDSDNVQETVWRTLCCDVDPLSGVKAPASTGDAFLSFLRWIPWWVGSQSERKGNSDPHTYIRMLLEGYVQLVEESSTFLKFAAPFCLERRVAITADGWCAQIPGGAQVGDVIFLPLGSAVPLVLRMDLDGYILQGECYVHGVMNGELMRRDGMTIEDITLV